MSRLASKVTPADDLVLPKNVNHPHPDIITYKMGSVEGDIFNEELRGDVLNRYRVDKVRDLGIMSSSLRLWAHIAVVTSKELAHSWDLSSEPART